MPRKKQAPLYRDVHAADNFAARFPIQLPTPTIRVIRRAPAMPGIKIVHRVPRGGRHEQREPSTAMRESNEVALWRWRLARAA